MKVGEATNQFPEFPQQKKVKEKGPAVSGRVGTGASKELAFKETFFNAADAQIRSSLDELMGALQAQGERLAQRQTFEELTKYRKLVQSFLAKASRDLYRLQSPQTSEGAGKGKSPQKIHVLLQKVDLELEKLAKMVLGAQTPQLRILEKLGQIKGMLLDAYL